MPSGQSRPDWYEKDDRTGRHCELRRHSGLGGRPMKRAAREMPTEETAVTVMRTAAAGDPPPHSCMPAGRCPVRRALTLDILVMILQGAAGVDEMMESANGQDIGAQGRKPCAPREFRMYLIARCTSPRTDRFATASRSNQAARHMAGEWPQADGQHLAWHDTAWHGAVGPSARVRRLLGAAKRSKGASGHVRANETKQLRGAGRRVRWPAWRPERGSGAGAM